MLFPCSISNRTIIPYQHSSHIVYQTVPLYRTNSISKSYQHTQVLEHASARRKTMAERQVHKSIYIMPSGLHCCTNTTSTQEHTLYRYHTTASTPQVHKSMPSLVRYHTAVPNRLLGISYNVTSDIPERQVHKSILCLQGGRTGTSIDRASSAQENMPSWRLSRNEHRYHTAVSTRLIIVPKSMGARDEQHHKSIP